MNHHKGIALGLLVSATFGVNAGVVKDTVKVDPAIVHHPYSADMYSQDEPVVIVGEPQVKPSETDRGERTISHAKNETLPQILAGNEAEPEERLLSFHLTSGLLKPQLEALVKRYLPDREVYWGNYEGKHEWYGDALIEGKSVEDLLNKITGSYGKPPKGIAWYIHRNVVEFVYKNSKG